jgi:hypothetical protein
LARLVRFVETKTPEVSWLLWRRNSSAVDGGVVVDRILQWSHRFDAAINRRTDRVGGGRRGLPLA